MSLFPLRLTPFEAVMFWDDRPEYPMVFWGELELSGRLDEEALRQAVKAVLPRHPLLRAGVEHQAGYPYWTACTVDEYPWEHIVFSQPDEPAPCYPVGPQWQGSFRLTVTPLTKGESNYRFLFQMHHATADGIAACMLVGEVLAAYDSILRGEAPDAKLATISAERLKERLNLPPIKQRIAPPVTETAIATVPPPKKTWRDWWYEVGQSWKFSTTYPAILSSPKTLRPPRSVADAHAGPHECTLVSVMLSREESDQIRHLATDGSGINDVLMAWLFHALQVWNDEHGSFWSRGTYRVTMPANLRPAGERSLPSANCISYAFLDRHHRECQEPAKLLPGITHATRAILRYDLTRQFLAFLASSCRFPRWFRWNIRRAKRMSSTVLSYVGDPTRRFTSKVTRDGGQVKAGELTVDRFVGAPPVRPGMRVAMAVTTYRERIGIGLSYDRKYFGREGAEEFLKLYTRLMLEASK